MANTLQSKIKRYNKDMTRYSLFLGGLNVKSDAIQQYSPLITGRARIFFVKMPRFMDKIMPQETKNFKHLLEYGNVSIDGLQNTNLETEQMGGGFAGRQFEVATGSKDDTSSFTIKVYEFAGSPVREYTDMWITGIGDPYVGLGTYHGAIDDAMEYGPVNHTAEAYYVHTGPTGDANDIEYCCFLANMMPKAVKKDHFNYESGTHSIVQVDIEFTCTKYESPQINTVGKALMEKYQIIRDYLDYDSGYTPDFVKKNLPDSNIQDWNNK